MRSEPGDGRFHGRGADWREVVAVPPGVEDLHGDPASVGVYGLRHQLVVMGLATSTHLRSTEGHSSGRVRRYASGHDESHPSSGSSGVELGHLREVAQEARLLQTGVPVSSGQRVGGGRQDVHGAHDDAVLQSDPAVGECKRLEQQGKLVGGPRGEASSKQSQRHSALS